MKAARAITIRRCTLRVTRRGGWSWGADAQSLVRRAIDRLPSLLERTLGNLGGSLPADLEICEPVRLRVSLGSRQWSELTGGAELGAQLRAQLEASVGAALAQALPPTVRATLQQGGSSEVERHAATGDEVVHTESNSTSTTQAQASSLWNLLVQWRAAGRLPAQLASLDEAVLRLWLERLLDVEPASRAVAVEEDRLPALWGEVCALPMLLPRGTPRALARRILFVLDVKSRWHTGKEQLRELLLRHCADEPVDDEQLTAAVSRVDASGAFGASTGASATALNRASAPASRAAPAIDASFEMDIPCALPFLMLTPLSRSGYLATLAAALEAAHATELAAGFALGLAHKSLAAPQRGWLRDAGSLAAAAAFTARSTCDNEFILDAGRALRPQLALLDGCVLGQLLLGHRAEAAWLIARDASDNCLLFDEDGLAPVAGGEFAALASRIAPSGSVLFLPSHVASAAHLDVLDELQIPYSSDGDLKSRRGCNSFVTRDGARLWVSAHGAQQGRARGIADRGTALTEAALANWQALHENRPAQRPGVDPALEISLSLAAGYALSAIAWTLWKERARATALTALENFADLDARVRVTPERVHVILPMGRRAWDLRDHGLLGDVREVPWLGARTVTFGVG